MRRVHLVESICAHTFTASSHGTQQEIRTDPQGLPEQERLLPLGIHSSGVSRWAEGDHHEWSSTLLSVNLITAGDAEYEQEGRRGYLVAGDVVLMHKGNRHGLATGPKGFMHHRYVRLEGRALETALRAAGVLDIDSLRPAAPARVCALMREAHRLLLGKPPGYYAQLSRIAYALIVECAQGSPQQIPGPMARALNFIDRNTTHALSLAEIARAAQVSRRTCSRMFVRRFDRSPVVYATARRLSVAADMLASTTLSSKQVGIAVGYRDPSHFTLAFRRQYGKSPQRFREQTAQGKAEWE